MSHTWIASALARMHTCKHATVTWLCGVSETPTSNHTCRCYLCGCKIVSTGTNIGAFAVTQQSTGISFSVTRLLALVLIFTLLNTYWIPQLVIQQYHVLVNAPATLAQLWHDDTFRIKPFGQQLLSTAMIASQQHSLCSPGPHNQQKVFVCSYVTLLNITCTTN